jgi:hypothetical protein
VKICKGRMCSISPHILNVSTKYRWSVNFMPRLLYISLKRDWNFLLKSFDRLKFCLIRTRNTETLHKQQQCSTYYDQHSQQCQGHHRQSPGHEIKALYGTSSFVAHFNNPSTTQLIRYRQATGFVLSTTSHLQTKHVRYMCRTIK